MTGVFFFFNSPLQSICQRLGEPSCSIEDNPWQWQALLSGLPFLSGGTDIQSTWNSIPKCNEITYKYTIQSLMCFNNLWWHIYLLIIYSWQLFLFYHQEISTMLCRGFEHNSVHHSCLNWNKLNMRQQASQLKTFDWIPCCVCTRISRHRIAFSVSLAYYIPLWCHICMKGDHTGSCACKRSWKLRTPKSVPVEVTLSHWKLCSWNAPISGTLWHHIMFLSHALA